MRCDCGWDFASGTVKESYLHAKAGAPDPAGLASLSDRLGGQALDTAIAIGLAILGSLASNAIGHSPGDAPPVGALLGLLYLLLADGLGNGQSVGKRVLKMSVVDATTGKPCTFGQSFLRNLPMILGIIDWIFIFRDNRQRLGDRLANTVVITTATVEVPGVAGPALSNDEAAETRQVYAGLPTWRLQALLASPADLRPGAIELLREELDRRHEPVAQQVPEA
jgi:uncharacterized RDD family membrane protein YckC